MEDEQQISVFKLTKTLENCDMRILFNKTETMGIKRLNTIRNKTGINEKIIEQVKMFRYLGNEFHIIEKEVCRYQ